MRRRGRGARSRYCRAADTERLFRRVARSSGFVSSAGLSLLAFQKPTGLDQDDAACLEAFDCYRRMRPPHAAISAVRLSPHLEAAQHLLKRPSLPSSRLLCLPLICNRLCREAAPRHACRRTPLLRVNRADTAEVAALSRACSDCALRRRDAALLIRHNIQIDYSNAAFIDCGLGRPEAMMDIFSMQIVLRATTYARGRASSNIERLIHKSIHSD